MDTIALVEEKIHAGGELIDQLRKHGLQVDVAVWALNTYDERWYLYLALPIVDAGGLTAGYGEVNKVRSQNPLDWAIRSDIRLVGSQDPLALEAIKYRSHKLPTRFGGRKLGNLIIDDAYIYPAT